ncbi:5'-nucleotidase-like [Amphiura filiformis]|uniref:5'-nucleotidase-like n=1 Tax=Amphiura filiformis TaxID=82378 RepID=UPI003B2279AD
MYSVILILSLVPFGFGEYDLTILHTNDVHDRMEQLDSGGGSCSVEEAENGECYGGFARLSTMVKHIRKYNGKDIRKDSGNVLFLDAGDQFQGTNWFVHYKGAATSYFMNKIGYDVQALGNHEFDLGPSGLAPFLKDVDFPVISCNIDASKEPVIDGLFNKSVILTVGGERIGVVGYTYSRTDDISATGQAIFNDEIESLQAEIDVLLSQGINKIIALGHSGIMKDLDIAAKVKGVDIVVGGHSNTFLYTGTPPDTAGHEVLHGEYPKVITPDHDPYGTVLVVTAYTFAKYLGRLDVTFDNDGRVTQWAGNPILLNSDVEEDPNVLVEINQWSEVLANLSSVKLGVTHVYLDGKTNSCRLHECNMGNMITDAYIWEQVTFPDDIRWSDVNIAIHNSGNIRASIQPGNLDTSVVSEYIERFSPIYAGVERRITFITDGNGSATVSMKQKDMFIYLILTSLIFTFVS